MQSTGNAGLDALLDRPLIETIWQRRTHRVSQGSSVLAGSMSYQSKHPHEPLSELEEAMLIAMTGCTGLTMPDRPVRGSGDPHAGHGQAQPRPWPGAPPAAPTMRKARTSS